MERKNYERASVEIILFRETDVITCSGDGIDKPSIVLPEDIF